MNKQRKPLSTKKPPIPQDDHDIIKEWMNHRVMPGIKPMIKEIDSLIHNSISNLNYAIKWGNAFYGSDKLGWVIEVASYDVSANIVFLSGAMFDPRPPLGTGERTRYIKIKTAEELNDPRIVDYIIQAGRLSGWKSQS